MSTSPTSSHPFDDAREADIVIRTSDAVKFFVYKNILSIASPVFKDMFGLPQSPSPSCLQQLPSVSISESSAVIKPLLLICYPLPSPSIDNLNDAHLILEAATKYDMECVIHSVTHQLLNGPFLTDNPVAVYCLACCFGLEELARGAAFASLRIRSLGRPSVAIEELHLITADEYDRLLRFHFSCGIAAAAAANGDLQWVKWSTTSAQHYCETVSRQQPAGPDKKYDAWFLSMMEALADELKEAPVTSTITNSRQFDISLKRVAASSCKHCLARFTDGSISKLKVTLSRKVESQVKKVILDFTCS